MGSSIPLISREREDGLLDEDGSPPGERPGAEGDAGECQRGKHKALVLSQANQILLENIID